MILRDLVSYAQEKENNQDILFPKQGWSVEAIAWELGIDEKGRLVSVVPLGDEKSKGKRCIVPEHIGRTSGIKAFPLCDTSAYLMGRDEKCGQEKREASIALHKDFLEACSEPAADAVIRFLEHQEISPAAASILPETDGKGLIVFRYLPTGEYIHEIANVVHAWDTYYDTHSDGLLKQCSIYGEPLEVAGLFPQITGFPGAQSAGASLVSFNCESFCSYGKKAENRCANAAISKKAAAQAGAALNYLFKTPMHRVPMAGGQVLIWTNAVDEKPGCEFLSMILDLDKKVNAAKEDELLLKQIYSDLKNMMVGLPPASVSRNDTYHLLGLWPNASRLSVRFYETGTMGRLAENIGQYLADTTMVGNGPDNLLAPRSVRFYVEQTAPFSKADSVPYTVTASSVEALLKNRPLPALLYNGILARTRVDHGIAGEKTRKWDALGYRAAIMRAYLVRKARLTGDAETERSITVSLNEEYGNVGYLLGRLFAALEKAQKDAIPNANATIRDRYMSAASSTPARVFPQLLRNAQHHIAKADRGFWDDRTIGIIVNRLDAAGGFPVTLSYDDQGQFYIGYYQQKQALYTKRGTSQQSEEEEK